MIRRTLPFLLLASACSTGDAPTSERRTIDAEYVSDASCRTCHEYEFERWTGSHHDLAMAPATEEYVLGDFDDATFDHFGEVTRFSRDGPTFVVTTAGADGVVRDYDVSWTFGVEPLQQYLIELEDGRIQCLSVAWDTAKEEWFHLYPDEPIPPNDPLHWTGRYQRWNAMCAECHSTDLVKNYDLATDGYATTWKELDVGCQACHGPGSAHVAWASEGKASAPAPYEPADVGLVTGLRRHAQAEQMNACAPCHSRRSRLVVEDEPGAPFLDRFVPERLHQGYYHPDGQMIDEVYVYGSFAQTKMYLHGVACTDCHDPHSLELLVPGNGVCTQCHTTNPPTERFPTLPAKEYDDPSHHHHETGTEGAACVSCHMPERTYMVVDARRDHSFRIPRPDLAAAIGTPDACSTCHEEGPVWAAERVVEWYGEERGRHFGPVFAAAQIGHPDALQALGAIATDRESTPIVRATAVELLRPYGNSGLQGAMAALEDEDALVRAAAVGALEDSPDQLKQALLPSMLADPIRLVRIEVARVLSSMARLELSEADAARLEAAKAEFFEAQDAQADMPAAHLNLGIYHSDRGENEAAEASYRTANRLDPYFLPSRFNLANLLNRAGKNDEAEKVLREALTYAPENGELWFSLALLLAEMGDDDGSLDAMRRVTKLLPDRPRVHYNLGILLKERGELIEAESALLTAVAKDERNADALHALVLVYKERQEWQSAIPWAEKLVALVPRDPTARELLDECKRRANGR